MRKGWKTCRSSRPPASVQRFCVMKSTWQLQSSSHIHTSELVCPLNRISAGISRSPAPKPHFTKKIGQGNGPAYDIKHKFKTTMCCFFFLHIVRAYQGVSSGFQTLHFLVQLLSCRVYNSPLTSSLISLAAPSDDKKNLGFSLNSKLGRQSKCSPHFPLVPIILKYLCSIFLKATRLFAY